MMQDLKTITVRNRRGFTLVEAVVCMVIVATMFVAALTTVAGAAQARAAQAGWRKADTLARVLLGEMQAQAYGTTGGSIVPLIILGQTPSDRLSYNDVDDYHDLNESPPLSRDGVKLPGYDRWRWAVSVERVDPADPLGASTRGTDKGMKRVTITVQGPHTGGDDLTLTMLRSRWSFADMAPLPGQARAHGAAVRIQMVDGGEVAAGAWLPNGPVMIVANDVADAGATAVPSSIGGEKAAESGGLVGVVGGVLGALLGGGK